MAIIDSVVTYEGENAGLFLKPVTENPLITDLGFQIIDNTVVTKYLYLNTELDKITKKRVGCGWVATGTGNSIYRKAITPVDMQSQMEQCADAFKQTIFMDKLPKGVDVNDLTGTQVETMLIDFINPTITRDALRIMLLGDTSLSNTDYSALDGFYKHLKVGSLTDGIVNAGTVTSTDLLVANIQATLKRVVDAAHIKLRQVPNAQKALYVTETVYDAWKNWMQTNAALQSSKDQLVNGIESLKFDGIELIKLSIVDEYASDFATGSPATFATPNRIVYSKKDNNVLAIDTASSYTEVKFWYEPKDDMNYSRVRYAMAYTYKYAELVTIAGF